jgi:hypothetical protein
MSAEALRLKLREKSYLWAYIGGTAALLICGIIWWFTVYLGPRYVFWSMIHNSLATSSVVLRTDQTSGTDQLKQLIQVDTATAQKARSLTILKQEGTEIKTEILGTKDTDYTRYLGIKSESKADTSKVLNIWSKSDETQQSETQAGGHQLYAQATLGIGLPLGSVPIAVGSLTPNQRTTLYDYIRTQNVYAPDFGKVKKERKNGRLLYTYEVKMQTILYVSMMKAFAKDLGLHELDAANPNSYQNSPTLTISVTVDAYSHQLASVNFTDLGYSQYYESYGLPLKAEIPKQTIPESELQKRLTDIGQQKQ